MLVITKTVTNSWSGVFIAMLEQILLHTALVFSNNLGRVFVFFEQALCSLFMDRGQLTQGYRGTARRQSFV